MASAAELAILISAKDQASKVLGSVGGKLQGIAKAAAVAGAAGGAALVGLGALAVKQASEVQTLRTTFENLASSVGQSSDEILASMQKASSGLMSNAQIFESGNKLMAMGLASTADEAGKLTHMATTLGRAMGTDAQSAMENFTLMLANQSIPRLDTFGISSGKVRERIEELTSGTKALTREQAFMQAVMEQGSAALERVGDVALSPIEKLEAMKIKAQNLFVAFGTQLLPIADALVDGLSSLGDMLGGLGSLWGEAGEAIDDVVSPAEKVRRNLEGFGGLVSPLGAAEQAVAHFAGVSVDEVRAAGDEMAKLKGFDRFVAQAVHLFEMLAPKAVAALETWAAETISYVQAQLPVWTNQIMEWGLKLWQWVEPQIPVVLGKMGQWAGALMGYLGDSLPGWTRQLADWGVQLVLWIVDHIPDAVAALKELVLKLASWLQAEGLAMITGFGFRMGQAILGGLFEGIKGLGQRLWDFISEIAKRILESLISFFTGGATGFTEPPIPEFKAGGVVPGPIGSPQLIMAHGGEVVSGLGATRPMEIVLMLDRDVVGRVAWDYMKNQARLGTTMGI